MKRVLATVTFALFAAAAAAGGPLIARQGNDSVRFFEEPCSNAAVLDAAREYAPNAKLQRALAVFGGQMYEACWRMLDAARLHLIYDDGDQGLVPVADLKEDQGA